MSITKPDWESSLTSDEQALEAKGELYIVKKEDQPPAVQELYEKGNLQIDKINAHTTSIATNTSNISPNASDISTNSSKVTTNISEIAKTNTALNTAIRVMAYPQAQILPPGTVQNHESEMVFDALQKKYFLNIYYVETGPAGKGGKGKRVIRTGQIELK